MAQVTYKASINLTKCCILLLYLRLFRIVRWFRWSCWAILACVASYLTASVTATIFQCQPVMRAFDKSLEGTCIDMAKFWFANAGFSIATDIIILLLPMPLVWRLEVPTAQKVALMAVFAVGLFVVVTSCLRVTTLDIFAKSADNTYNIANVMWTIVEPNVAVMCACLPILRPFVVKLFPSLRSKSYPGAFKTPEYDSAKSRDTNGSQPRAPGRDWVELGGVQHQALHQAAMQRPASNTGSEESILAAAQTPKDVSPGIHKTVEYSIKYTRK